MISIRTVTSTCCFVKQGEGLAQVVWLDLASVTATRAEAWAEGARAGLYGPLGRDVGRGRHGARGGHRGAAAGGGGGRYHRAVRSGCACRRRRGGAPNRRTGRGRARLGHVHGAALPLRPGVVEHPGRVHLGLGRAACAQAYRRPSSIPAWCWSRPTSSGPACDPAYKFVLAEVDYLKPFWDLYPGPAPGLRQLVGRGPPGNRGRDLQRTQHQPGRHARRRCGLRFTAWVSSATSSGAYAGPPGSSTCSATTRRSPASWPTCGLTSSSWARGPFHQWGPTPSTGADRLDAVPQRVRMGRSRRARACLTSYMPTTTRRAGNSTTASTLDEADEACLRPVLRPGRGGRYQSQLCCRWAPTTRRPTSGSHELPRAWAARYAWPRFVVARCRRSSSPPCAPSWPKGLVALAADPRHGPGLHRQGRLLHRHQAGPPGGRKRPRGGREAGDLPPGARAIVTRGRAGQGVAPTGFNAHHDGITGSESDQVYLDLLAGWREAWELATTSGRRPWATWRRTSLPPPAPARAWPHRRRRPRPASCSIRSVSPARGPSL